MTTLRAHSNRSESTVRAPTLSVVIPARNEENNIERCVSSIWRYLPSNMRSEVIVCDHGSTDATRRIALEAGARVIDHVGGTVGNLRNIGVRSASSSLILFLDADVELTSEWRDEISAVLADLERNPKQIIGSICEVPPSDNLFIAAWFSRLDRTGAKYLGTAHMLVPKALFDSLGGFDATLVSGEDVDFCQRAASVGASIAIVPKLRVFHHDYPTSASRFVSREVWHGAGDFASFERFRRSRVALVSSFVTGLLFSSFVAGILREYMAAALLCSMALISAVICSFAKFPKPMRALRLANIYIFILYLLARGFSGFQAIFPKLSR